MKTRLERKDHAFIITCIIISLICIGISLKYFWKAFPEASIKFNVDRIQSQQIATSYLADRGFQIVDYKHAAIFDYDDETKVFLERSLTPEEVSKVLSTEIKLWRWSHRWFKPLQKEEFQVDVTPDGSIASFSHLIPEEKEGANLDSTSARNIALDYLSNVHGFSRETLELLYSENEKRINRTDHIFTWKRKGINIAEADYRLKVTVCGDAVAGYKEFLKVPEEWSRGYKELRSLNDVTGQIAGLFIILTIVAMLVFFVWKIWHHDIRWKISIIFGLIAVILTFFSFLNSYQPSLFGYDTTTSFPRYISWQIIMAVLSSMLVGAFIFLLTASAEPIYREYFKDKISLSNTFRWQGIRTKSFFLSCVLGLTMTFFFIAYQTIFYIIANRFGAWAPNDVPYSEMLNTTIPWIYVLFFGFYPAVSEEFISRMFSIPFLQKFLRSRWLAIIFSAFIWGFAHSNYPNQPFYIRGIEVGIAGVIIGYIMIKTNILTTLIWHYSVDAIYTSILLIRSGNLYFTVSGIMTASVTFVPLVIALGWYLVKGQFADDEQILNTREQAPPSRVTFAHPEIKPVHYKPMSKIRRLFACILAVLFFSVFAWDVPRFGDSVDFTIGPNTATQTSNDFLLARNVDPNKFQNVTYLDSQIDKFAVKYILDNQGVEGVKQIYEDLITPLTWEIRYFIPQEKEEYLVSIDPAQNTVVSFKHTIIETAPGAKLDQQAAKDLAETFLADWHFNLETLDLKESDLKKEKNRNDHIFAWEAKNGDPRNVGMTKYRIDLKIQGDNIDFLNRKMRVPEEWTRKRQEDTIQNTISEIAVIILLFGVTFTGALALLKKIRERNIFWSWILWVSASLASLTLLSRLNSLPTILALYPTEYPIHIFYLSLVVGFLLIPVAFFILYCLVFALLTSLIPDLVNCLHAKNRSKFFTDTVLTTICMVSLFFLFTHIVAILSFYLPESRTSLSLNIPDGLGSYIPALSILVDAIFLSILITTLVVLITYTMKRYLRLPLIPVAIFAAAFFIAGISAKTSLELIVPFCVYLFMFSVVLGLLNFLTKNNPVALPVSVFSTLLLNEILFLFSQSYWYYRLNGAILVCTVLIIFAFLLRKPKPTDHQSFSDSDAYPF